MAGESLNLSETLRPWRQAGLRYVFKAGASSQDARSAAREPEDWPSPWRELWAKLKNRPRQIWTYFELGQDVGGKPDAARRALWGRLLGQLGWPGGSVLFWPHSLWGAQGLSPETCVFFEALDRLKPCTLTVFGRLGFETLFPDQAYAPGESLWGDLKVLALPSPGELLAEPELLAQALQRLGKT